MDTSVHDITFDINGVCNYCSDFLIRSGHIIFKDPVARKQELVRLVERVKADGRGKRYDCIIGVSGGVDSSWTLVEAVRLGLRPLAVHMDNGWNSELAQSNIANLVSGLGVDLYTHVIDWQEYKSLMQAFFDAHVVDIEILYDNAMLAVNYKLAARYKVHHILAGTNLATEGLSIPTEWNWFKFDKINIKSIARKFGGVKILTFPAIGTFDVFYYAYLRKIKWVSFLDYLEYQKNDSLEYLAKNFNYKKYPYKHYESVFTRFYQGYILPNKFNIDKRRVHFSNLIISNQMFRNEALRLLKDSPYPSNNDLNDDIRYFLKKMGWSQNQLKSYIGAPGVSHAKFSSERKFWNIAMLLYRRLFQ